MQRDVKEYFNISRGWVVEQWVVSVKVFPTAAEDTADYFVPGEGGWG